MKKGRSKGKKNPKMGPKKVRFVKRNKHEIDHPDDQGRVRDLIRWGIQRAVRLEGSLPVAGLRSYTEGVQDILNIQESCRHLKALL